MKISLKKAFSILDGRLSTNVGDLYEMFNYIFSDNLYTHQLPAAMRKLEEVNPEWFRIGKVLIQSIKDAHQTDDFNELMKIIDTCYSTVEIELVKIDYQIQFSDGLVTNN